MSPSEPAPPEVTAIAVALVALWQVEELAGVEVAPVAVPSPWRMAGRRWERPAGHRWS
ncbi:MAG: hypothetical protein M3Y04_07880 [Actinomycetota bacterium]|nr:hypothetical protein [Actinomycetota bacterium]